MFHFSLIVLLLLLLLLLLLFFYFLFFIFLLRGAAPPNGRPPFNQEPFGPQEGEREGPDGPLWRNALVSLGSFVAIFRTRLRPPFLFVCLTPFPFALLFLFSFFRLIDPLYYCGLSWPFWSYHVVRRFIYVLYHRCC